MNANLKKSKICIFIARVYVKVWFTCHLATEAPGNDLSFVKELIYYESTDSKISQVALTKFSKHLWYLNPETAAMAFFYEKISLNIKKEMVIMLKSVDNASEKFKRFENKNKKDLYNSNIATFISSRSLEFFKRFGVSTDFLSLDPSEWCYEKSFKADLLLVRILKVVNDIAERVVKLIEEYNSILSKNLEQHTWSILGTFPTLQRNANVQPIPTKEKIRP